MMDEQEIMDMMADYGFEAWRIEKREEMMMDVAEGYAEIEG